jgi:hypothetical protein
MSDWPQVGLKDQRPGLERRPRRLAGKAGRGRLAQRVVGQQEEWPRRPPVAPLDVG